MFLQQIQNTGLVAISLTSLVVCVLLLILRKPKRRYLAIPSELQDARIKAFEPEPLVESKVIDDKDELPLEITCPDSNDPTVLNLAKINFLNLLNNQQLRDEAQSCIEFYGVGPCGPRGFYGTVDVHLTLESRIAKFMDLEESVLYSYGFSTVSSAIGAYCKKSDILFCDEKVNFCVQQGLKAARSTVEYFKHNDMEDLEYKLKIYSEKEQQRKRPYRKFLIVEGIYATTGTICPLPELMSLRKKYQLRMFLDESLSFGVLGKTGRGITEHFNVDRTDVDMIMSSLEGSVASIGGFCVGASVIIEHQRLSGLGYCFSASLPPFLSQIAISTLDIFDKNPSMFEELRVKSVQCHDGLNTLKDYKILSDRLSPLKVITTNSTINVGENLKKIRELCNQKKIYMLLTEETLSFYVNVNFNDEELSRVTRALEESYLALDR